MIENIVHIYNVRYIFVSESNEIITILIPYIMNSNFLTSDNLPLNDQFVDLPYKTEKIRFTGVVSEERNDGFNSFVIASTIIINNNGQQIEGFVRFNYCMEQSKFVKMLDCNFFKL